MNRVAGAFIGLTAVVAFLIGLVVASTRPPVTSASDAIHVSTPVEPLRITTAAADTPVPVGPAIDFASVVARVNQAVVNVDTASRGLEVRPRYSRRYSTDDATAPREGSGSGFIIDPAGFILTNHHVVAGADRVTVTLGDGRAFKASVIGTDAAIDVALLKIDAREPLPTAPLGSSDGLRVGEWVCAIGNPLGVYVHSVTVGVVSYLGRKLFDHTLDAYIQTDAAIAFGNSGGPLINARGEVVGITTAISAQAANIGFAIPISQVAAVLGQLREHGSVARGDLGAALTTLTSELRDALDIEPRNGALIQDVLPNSPAARAGLRPYDVVVQADGRPVESDEALVRYVAAQAPGSLTSLAVWRDGRVRQVPVRLAVRPVVTVGRRVRGAGDAKPAAQDQAPLGLAVRDLEQDLADRLGLDDTVRGVLVAEVDPAGPARIAQLRTNHVILEINRIPVRSVAEYRRVVAAVRPGEAVALLVYDRTTRQHVICTVVSDPPS